MRFEMGWILLVVAGLFEIGWIINMKTVDGFTRLVPVVRYAVLGAGAAYFLSLSLRTLPLAPAYIIWMGIGLVGAAVWGVVVLKEPLGWLKTASMVLVLAGAVGLKVADDQERTAARGAHVDRQPVAVDVAETG